MGYLVCCPCGHAIERHGKGGCRAEFGRRCNCRLSLRESLHAATPEVRVRSSA